MSEVPPDPQGAPEPELMPRWVPVAIGVVLVTLAALAVITGLRYRDDTLVGIVESRRMPQATGGSPGAPEAGASRMMSDGGANVPPAGAPLDEPTFWARRGIMVRDAPADAVVYVNDVPVGRAGELDSENEVYDFAAPGTYTVRIVARGGEERRFVVTVSHDAEQNIALLDYTGRD